MLDVMSRSQCGRVCVYSDGEVTLRTPAVLRAGAEGPTGIVVGDKGRTVRIAGNEVSVDPELLTSAGSGTVAQPLTRGKVTVLRLPVTGDEIIPDDSEIVVVPNAFEVKEDFRRMVDQVMKARNAAGFGRLLVMLGIAEPSNAAFLAYMGVDVVDDGFCNVAGMNGILTLPEAKMAIGKDCTSENAEELEREISKIASFIGAQRLRELVDQRSFSDSDLVAALRIFDADGYDYQEECFSVTGVRFSCNTVQALRRPDIARYENRMRDLYSPPKHKKVLLLLPCSAKKPYHISRTHRMFASAIHTAQHDTLVHEVIVTSPLGIVPRELDAMYPANSYDIPVTGEWKPEEKDRIRRMLKDLVSKGGYEKVVSHMGEDDELVRDLFPDMVSTFVGDPVSPASLDNLDKALREAAKGYENLSWNADRDATVRSALTYQFGPEIADAIMDANTVSMGKYPYWKVFRVDPENPKKKTQICMMSAERGMFSLSPEGAQILVDLGYHLVETVDDFAVKGSLYAVGVKKADHGIRIGDEAVVVYNGQLRGVGVAMMCGREMEQARRGVAIRMRHAV
ncbi:Queuine tRNA-ribosyltransferase containing PUA domain [Thermoplasmatales archaeon BRNA1]|nr:Queuine tRNA-ribosyltransferase containing PUA domain [Thermoplasmatales archaeon BRNA1]